MNKSIGKDSGYFHILIFMCYLLFGCAPVSQTTGVTDEAGRHSASIENIKLSDEEVDVASVVAAQYAGFLMAIRDRPDELAVQKFAEAMSWKSIPERQLELFNAKTGYVGKLQGYSVIIGGDGTNDVFSISYGPGFESDKLIESIGTYVDLKHLTSRVELGQKEEIWLLTSNGEELGVLMMYSGLGDGIRGTGTVSYMSRGRTLLELNAP